MTKRNAGDLISPAFLFLHPSIGFFFGFLNYPYGKLPFTGLFFYRYRDLPLNITIDYKGDIYTDIPKLSTVFHELGKRSHSPGFCGIRFFARKNGGELAEYYLLTKVMFADPDDFPPVTLSPSIGIVEVNSDRLYLGAANYSKKEKKFSTERNGSNCSSTAIHEVGHAVVSLMLDEEPFEIITIIPRGDYILGYVSPSELKRITKSDYENRIRVSMGGRIAEELIYGKDNISVGALQDMQNATHNARFMVEQVGLTEDFGFMTLSETSGRYLGGERYYTCSDAFRERNDNAVNAMLKKLYGETLEMLADKKELIVRLAERVFEAETMDGRKFKELYEKELKRLLNN